MLLCIYLHVFPIVFCWAWVLLGPPPGSGETWDHEEGMLRAQWVGQTLPASSGLLDTAGHDPGL